MSRFWPASIDRERVAILAIVKNLLLPEAFSDYHSGAIISLLTMANSRGRRKLRRALKEAGLRLPPPPPPTVQQGGPPATPPPSPPKPSSAPFWKRIPRWMYACIALFAIVITMLEGYPWLSLQKDESLDMRNPYRTLFVAINDGYILLTNVNVECTAAFTTSKGTHVDQITFPSENVAQHLWHSEKFTLPCFNTVVLSSDPAIAGRMGAFGIDPNDPISEATMKIHISYSFFHLNPKSLRRSQTFHVRALRGMDNSYHWEFLQ